MTVKQLMNKLKKLPDDAIVTIPNSSLFVDADYVATGVEFYVDDVGQVEITTDYKKRIWEVE